MTGALVFPQLLELLRHDDFTAVCHKPPAGRFTAKVVKSVEAPSAADFPQYDVWYGVNPVRGPARPGRGTADQVTGLTALYADLDVKPGGLRDFDTAWQVISVLAEMLGSRPMATTLSGHGLQPYWPLEDHPTGTDAQVLLRRFGRLVAAVAQRYDGAVDTVYDLARVLRVPGSVNHKDAAAPQPVLCLSDAGHPLTTAEVTEALDAYGVTTQQGDAENLGEVLAPVEQWTWADTTCRYAAAMIAGWERQAPPAARHPWLVGQATRLAAAHRNGCVTAADHAAAVQTLTARFRAFLQHPPIRKEAPGEVPDAFAWGRAKVAAKADLNGELGRHTHPLIAGDPATTAPSAATDADADEDGPADLPPSWRPVDLTPILTGTYQPETPALLPRDDDNHLLYAGRVHSLHGESESGKSLVAQTEAARLISAGHDVLYVDFESDASAIIGRLLELGAAPGRIHTHLTYLRPDNDPRRFAHEYEAFTDVLTRNYTLAVIDGVTDALGVFGASTKDNDDIASFMRAVPRTVARRTGAAVVLVDHVTKDPDHRGRFAVGGQAKMNALDGSAFMVEVVESLGRGLRGVISMRVAKDRPGGVRPHCGAFRKSDRTQEAARIVVDSTDKPGEHIDVTVEAPTRTVGEDTAVAHTFRPTYYMERVSGFLERATEPMSQTVIEEGVSGKVKVVRQALALLVAEGFAEAQQGARGAKLHVHRRSYYADEDPLSDTYVPDLINPPERPRPTPSPTPSHEGVSDPVPDPPPLRGRDGVNGRAEPLTSSPTPSQLSTGMRIVCRSCQRPIGAATAKASDGLCSTCLTEGRQP